MSCTVSFLVLSVPAVLLFTVFAAVDLVFLIREDKYMIQFLLNGSDASRIFAFDHVADLFRKRERLFGDDLSVLDNVHSDIVINEAEDIKIHKIDGTFDLHNVFFSHFAALGVFDDRHATVELVKVEIFVNLHALASLDMIQYKAFRNASHVQCIFYHNLNPFY